MSDSPTTIILLIVLAALLLAFSYWLGDGVGMLALD
jgi:hypothetical protein